MDQAAADTPKGGSEPPWSTVASGSAIQGECRNMVIWPVFFQRRLFLKPRAWNIVAACERADPARYSYVAEMSTGSEYG
jgi:hypothetical protein